MYSPSWTCKKEVQHQQSYLTQSQVEFRSCRWQLVLATVPNSRVGTGSGSDPEPNRYNGYYHTKTRTVAIGQVLPTKTQHLNIKTLASIKYLSSDRIVT
jgi:hypothetical protein